MKKLALVFTILCGLVAGTIPALAQTNGTNTNYGNAAFAADANGRVMASEYGKWQITTLTPNLRAAPDGRLVLALTKPHIVNPLSLCSTFLHGHSCSPGQRWP